MFFLLFYVLVLNFLCCLNLMYIFIFLVKFRYLSGHVLGKKLLIRLRYVLWYRFLVVNLGFFHLGILSENLFLIGPFPDRCLLVPL